MLILLHPGTPEPFPNRRDAALSATGQTEVHRACDRMRNVYPDPPRRIVTSPIPRALQSADIVRRCLGMGSVEVVDALDPATTAHEELNGFVKALEASDADTLIVVQNPELQLLVRHFIGWHGQDDGTADTVEIAIPPGTIVGVDLKQRQVAFRTDGELAPGDPAREDISTLPEVDAVGRAACDTDLDLRTPER